MDEVKTPEAAVAGPPVTAVEVPGETTIVLAPQPTERELETEAEREDPLGALSYRQLVWRRFRKSRLGLIGGLVLLLFYGVAVFAEFCAPYAATTDNIRLRYVPPQPIHFGPQGAFLYGLKQTRDPETLEIV